MGTAEIVLEHGSREQKTGLARCLTPIEDARERYETLGVAIFILNEKGEVLVIKENRSKEKTNRKRGEYGIPCETVESSQGEGWEAAVVRGLHEELGVAHDRISQVFTIDPVSCYAGEGVVSNVFARVYQINFTGSDEELHSYVTNEEVDVIGWVKPARLGEIPLREATRTILQSHSPLLPKAGPSQEVPRLPLSIENLQKAQQRCVEN